MNRHNKKPILYLVIASLLWSIGGLFIKLVDWNPIAIAGTRSGIAAIVMYIYLRKPIKKLDKMKVLGASSYALLLILFVAANKLTTSANAILLQFTAPIWVALFAGWFLKEKTKKSDWITIIIVVLGMCLFFIGDLDSGKLFGNILGLLSGVALAGVVIFLKLQKEGSPVEMTLLGNIFTFILAIPFYFKSVPSYSSILGLVILGVFQLGISYILYAIAIEHVSAIEAILIPVIEPLLNPVWVFLFTEESPGTYTLLGGTIVIMAIICRSLYEQRKNIKYMLPLKNNT